MTAGGDRLAQVARGWDEAADGYDAYYVPRFAPWVRTAVEAVAAADLPPGPVLVPCCGPFPELDVLTERLSDREIVGIDLSDGMVRRARLRTARTPGARVVQGDASALDAQWSRRCAAVVSVFGLQQLPEPAAALRSWVGALRPSGRLAVVYWPASTEDTGPFALAADVVRAHVPAGDDDPWEDRLVPALTAAGAVVERDELVPYPMTHESAEAFFDAHTRHGPLRALRVARGDAFVDGLRAEFVRRAPRGEWRHTPRARLLVSRVANA